MACAADGTRLAVAGSSRQDGADFRVTGKISLKHATPSSSAPDAEIIRTFAGIPGLLEQAPALIARGRFLDCECLLGPTDHPFHASIRGGRIVGLTPPPARVRAPRSF